jgi:hypothetical protein
LTPDDAAAAAVQIEYGHLNAAARWCGDHGHPPADGQRADSRSQARSGGVQDHLGGPAECGGHGGREVVRLAECDSVDFVLVERKMGTDGT